MTNGRAVWALMRADFRERTRRYSFFVTMLAAVYLAYAVYAGYIVLDVGHHRGVNNSAWVGILVAMNATFYVSLVGFYLIKNSVLRDRLTHVGEILATTPIGKLEYILGKTLSNFALLMAIVAVQGAAAAAMFFLKGTGGMIEPWKLFGPILLLTVPALAFIAALAVLFESVPVLRGGIGNVVYVFLWTAIIAVPVENEITTLDFAFLRPVQASMESAVRPLYPDYTNGFSLTMGGAFIEQKGSFTWEGLNWRPEWFAMRGGWFLYGLVLALAAALAFDRFDSASPAQTGAKRRKERKRPRLVPAWRLSFRSRFLQLTLAELRLALQGVSIWWYLVAFGLYVSNLLAPLDVVRAYLMPVLALWPALLWSGLGVRERLHRTDQVVFASPGILRRQFPAMLLSGVVVFVTLASGTALRLAVAGEWGALGGLAIAGAFIPALALALGVWTGSSKAFEAIYTVMWYLGPLEHVPEFDYLGVSPTALAAGTAPAMAIAAAGLLVAAYLGRRRQLLAL